MWSMFQMQLCTPLGRLGRLVWQAVAFDSMLLAVCGMCASCVACPRRGQASLALLQAATPLAIQMHVRCECICFAAPRLPARVSQCGQCFKCSCVSRAERPCGACVAGCASCFNAASCVWHVRLMCGLSTARPGVVGDSAGPQLPATPLAIQMHLLCDSQMDAAALRRLGSRLVRLDLVNVSNAAVHAAWKACVACVAGCGS